MEERNKNLETKTGTVRRIIRTRGYGFISMDDGGDIFFHCSGVISPAFEELREGHPVEFLFVEEDPIRNNKARAIGVTVA